MTSKLFEPLQIRGLTLKNRIVVAPMMQHAAQNGLANHWHLVHLGKFALGGAGLILTESTAVAANARGGKNDLGLWADEQVPALRSVVDFVHDSGSLIGVQLGHAGRKAGTRPLWEGGTPLSVEEMQAVDPNWVRMGPSDLMPAPGWSHPQVMSIQDIDRVVEEFVLATIRAERAGFDVVELHYGHGYLVASFLSRVSNLREDEYGAGLEGRMHLALRIAREVRREWPQHKPLFCRLSCVDGALGGWGMDDTVVLAKALKDVGVDVIDCSSGGLTEQGAALPVARGLGFQVPFAHRVRTEAQVMTQAVGMIVDARQAEAIVRDGQADLIAIAREALKDPYWPLHAQAELAPDPSYQDWPVRHGIWLAKRHPALMAALHSATPR